MVSILVENNLLFVFELSVKELVRANHTDPLLALSRVPLLMVERELLPRL